jgi:hypothetical protein
MPEQQALVYPLLQAHFQPAALDALVVTARSFPARVRPDLQRAIDDLERGGDGGITVEDVDGAVEEMLFSGGSLNRKLLGCASPGFGAAAEGGPVQD